MTRNMSSGSVHKKKFESVYGPRRVGSLTSLNTHDSKRPGDYFISKMNSSSTSLPQQMGPAIRPKLGESIISLQSNISDETNNSQFDTPDSRLSSISSSSVVSPSESPSINSYNFSAITTSTDSRITEEDEDEVLSFDTSEDVIEQVQPSSSISTITLKNNSRSNLTYTKPHPRPKMRSLSTNSVLTSNCGLARTKSKYINAKEIKERQQLRKKLYDDNDDDDDILNNDFDLVFNVPVIRTQSELYLSKAAALSHNDLVLKNDKYLSKGMNSKPFPLPGKLNVNTNPNTSIEEEDVEITRNISSFYNQRSTSLSSMVKKTREQNLVYKLPSYVKSQSSIDDLSLMSPEKLNVLDQSRPINLPPKSTNDISKHNKELKRYVSDFEASANSHVVNFQKFSDSMVQSRKQWEMLHSTSKSPKEFKRKLYSGKNSIRNLCWNSSCPRELRYDILIGFLTLSEKPTNPERSSETIKANYDYLVLKIDNLPSSIKVNKDAEFSAIIEAVLRKPLYSSIIESYNEEFNLETFKHNFKTLLYLKSMTENGLKKHDELFLIPSLLLIFQGDVTMKEIFSLVELIDLHVFSTDVLHSLNGILGGWETSSKITKIFGDYSKEFKHLSSNNLWEILTQFSDRLPLSLSAPSTPVFQSFSSLSLKLDSPDISTQVVSSATLELVYKLIQALVVYINSSSPKKFHLTMLQGVLVTIFKYYHFGWNDYKELTTENISIKLNRSTEAQENLNSFITKWKESLLLV